MDQELYRATADFRRVLTAACQGNASSRHEAFNVVELEFAPYFKNGKAGFEVYGMILEAVKASGSEDAVKEYQKRFVPFCDKEYLGQMMRDALSSFSRSLPDEDDVPPPAPAQKKGFFRRLFGS